MSSSFRSATLRSDQRGECDSTDAILLRIDVGDLAEAFVSADFHPPAPAALPGPFRRTSSAGYLRIAGACSAPATEVARGCSTTSTDHTTTTKENK